MARKMATLGYRGLLLLMGSAATLALACGAYGMPSCVDDSDCTSQSKDWFCYGGVCDVRLDAGRVPDAGPAVDAGSPADAN